jgi:phytol kinase
MTWLLLDQNLWLRILLVPIWVMTIIVIAESLYLYRSINAEQVRKIVHIGTGNVILIAWWLHLPAWVGISSGIIAGVGMLISYFVPILPGVNGIGRKSFGTFFYAMSISLVTLWFWPINQPYYGAIGILIMSWGDGLAAIVGQKWGKHPYTIFGNQKSWEGSIAMIITSLIITTSILLSIFGNSPIIWAIGLGVAFIGTGLESLSWYGLDNLMVPLGTAMITYYLVQILPV